MAEFYQCVNQKPLHWVVSAVSIVQNVNLFYDNLEDLYKRFHFEPQAIYNVDETGLTTAQNPGKILAPKGIKQVGAVTSAERGTLVTLCCAVNALGHAMPPMFIFPRVRYHERFVDGGPAGCIGSCHKSGWMTKENFLIFLQHFVKHAKPSTAQPILLLLDNHESHISVEGIQYAKDNGVHLLSFPPHCSHRLQPLDCTVYFPLKRYFNAQCDTWCNAHPGRPMQPLDIPSVCAPAFQLAMTPANIQSGFEVTGIYPFNRHRISDDAFLPSSVTDRPDPTNASEALTGPLLTEGQSSELEPSNDVDLILEFLPAPPDAEAHASTSDLVASPNDVTSSAEPSIDSRFTNSHVETPTSGTSPSSLYVIRPLPKAGPRSAKRIVRKRGRTRILTDTPEKLLVEQENAARNLSKKSKEITTVDRSSGKKAKNAQKNVGRQKANKNQNNMTVNSSRPTKQQQTRKRCRKPLFQSDETDSEDETFCLLCTEPYSNSKSRERWVQCTICERWAHEACTDGSWMFVCQNCDSSDDM